MHFLIVKYKYIYFNMYNYMLYTQTCFTGEFGDVLHKNRIGDNDSYLYFILTTVILWFTLITTVPPLPPVQWLGAPITCPAPIGRAVCPIFSQSPAPASHWSSSAGRSATHTTSGLLDNHYSTQCSLYRYCTLYIELFTWLHLTTSGHEITAPHWTTFPFGALHQPPLSDDVMWCILMMHPGPSCVQYNDVQYTLLHPSCLQCNNSVQWISLQSAWRASSTCALIDCGVRQAVNSVQCTVYARQCTVHSVQFTVYSVQCTGSAQGTV